MIFIKITGRHDPVKHPWKKASDIFDDAIAGMLLFNQFLNSLFSINESS